MSWGHNFLQFKGVYYTGEVYKIGHQGNHPLFLPALLEPQSMRSSGQNQKYPLDVVRSLVMEKIEKLHPGILQPIA